jgi:hypothetical protein
LKHDRDMLRWFAALATNVAMAVVLLTSIGWLSMAATVIVGCCFSLLNVFSPNQTPPFGARTGPGFAWSMLRKFGDEAQQIAARPGATSLILLLAACGVCVVILVRVIGVAVGRLGHSRTASPRDHASLRVQEVKHHVSIATIIRCHLLASFLGYALYVIATLLTKAHWSATFYPTVSAAWIAWPLVALLIVSLGSGFQRRQLLAKFAGLSRGECTCGFPLAVDGSCPECGVRYQPPVQS